MKRLALATIAGIAMVIGVGCAGGAPMGQPAASASGQGLPELPADRQVSIVFESYNLATAGLGREGTQKLIDEFNAANPNIRVEGKGTPVADLLGGIQAAVVAGNPPDVAQIIFGDLDFAVNSLRAKALEDLVPAEELRQNWAGEHPFHPNGLKLGEFNDKTYSVPYVFSTPTLFYNADLLRQAGLNPDQPPKTFAELEQYGKQIKDRTGKEGSYISCIGPGAFDWCFQSVLLSAGGRVLSEDRSTLMFAEPASVNALKVWQGMVNSGAHSKLNSTQAQEAMLGGNLGLYLQTSALQSAILAAAKGKWELRAAEMPSFDGQSPARPTNSGSGLFLLAQDPLKQRAAWEFMKFMSSERAYTVITSEIGYLPLRPSIVNDERYLKAWAAEHPQVQPNLRQLDRLEQWVSLPGPNYVQIRDVMMKAAEEVVFNNADPQSTMAEAQRRAAALMPRSR